MVIYKSCNSIPIYNFYQIIDTNDYRFMIKDYEPEEERPIEIGESKSLELAELFKGIVAEYSELTMNQKVLADYNKQILIEYLEFEYNTCVQILELYQEFDSFEVVVLLREFGHQVEAESLEANLKKINNKLKGLKNKIRIHKINYAKKLDNKKNKSKRDLVRDAMSYEQILDLKYSIDIKNTSVKKWLTIEDMCKDKINMQKKRR